ncbi:MAG: class I SAM-dependent methyltransferase [Cyclobacteriaceae bacterium]
MSVKQSLQKLTLYRWAVDTLYSVVINPYRAWQIRNRHKNLSGADEKEIFKSIYESNTWGDSESASGTGSSLKATDHLRIQLPALLKKYNIYSVLDLPSGDFNWMRSIDLPGIQYTGADIVSEIVERNQAYADNHRKFVVLNLIEDQLPASDLILVRDCLVHLPFEQVLKAIENIKHSPIQYLLVTQFAGSKNEDIPMGRWRPLDLCAAPFLFPAPLEVISENLPGKFKNKSLALWRVKDL